MADPNPV